MLLSSSISRCRSTRASYLFSFHHFVIKIEYNIEINLFYRFLGSLSYEAKWIFWSINLDFLWPEIKICHQTSETFVSLRDMGIPIIEGWANSFTSCWQILVFIDGVPPIPSCRTKLRGSSFISKYWLYDITHVSPSTPHKLQQTTNAKCSPSSTKFKFTLCQMSILWTFQLLFFGICCHDGGSQVKLNWNYEYIIYCGEYPQYNVLFRNCISCVNNCEDLLFIYLKLNCA